MAPKENAGPRRPGRTQATIEVVAQPAPSPHSHAVTLTDKQVGRLSQYRRCLQSLPPGSETVFSHRLAFLCGFSSAQVRRDLMAIGFTGSPARGYVVSQLIGAIASCLDAPGGQHAALVGVGNLGRAILDYFALKRPSLSIVAAFDIDPQKADRVLYGCRTYRMDRLAEIVREEKIEVGILTVPGAAAQAAAELLVSVGVRSLLNFAPQALRLPPNCYVEEMDIAASMEKAAYFARALSAGREGKA